MISSLEFGSPGEPFDEADAAVEFVDRSRSRPGCWPADWFSAGDRISAFALKRPTRPCPWALNRIDWSTRELARYTCVEVELPQLGKIDPSSDRPPFRQIAVILREEITSGRLAPGDQLPSEPEMLSHFGVARATWRHALQELRNEGLIVSVRGLGVFVRAQPPVRRLSADRFARYNREQGNAAFSADAISSGFAAEVDSIEVRREQPSALVAERLQIAATSEVVVRSRRYLADGRAVQSAVSYIPVAFAEGTAIESENSGPGGIYARLEDNGHRLGRFTEEVGSRMPTPGERQALDLDAGIPVLTVCRVAYDADNVPVELCDTVISSDAYLLEYEIPAT